MSEETGFLGDNLRKFLKGEKEVKNPSTYKARIRDRTEASLFDFYYLFEYLDQEQVRKMFGTNFAPPPKTNHQNIADEDVDEVQEETTEEVYHPPATAAYVEFAVAFFLRGLNHGEQSIIPGYEEAIGQQQPMFDDFTEAIELGVQRYLRDKQDVYANVNVKIELEDKVHNDDLTQDPKNIGE